MDDFASLDTPGVSKGVKVVDLSAFEKKSAVLGWWHRPGEFFSLQFYQMLSNFFFISMAIKKVFLTVQIDTISNLSKKSILWNHNCETVQQKIGQCAKGFLGIALSWVCIRSDLKQIWVIPPTVKLGKYVDERSISRIFLAGNRLTSGNLSH